MEAITEAERPMCPDCGAPMHGSGTVWSGRQKVRRWRCSQCGRSTQRPPGQTVIAPSPPHKPALPGYRCPACGAKERMHKNGHKWCGRRQVQYYRCAVCGFSTAHPAPIPRRGRPPKNAPQIGAS